MSSYSSFNDWVEAEVQRKNENQSAFLIDKKLRTIQIRDTMLKSIKACNDAGRYTDKDLLLSACVTDFPVEIHFCEDILNELIRQEQIILCEGMLWLKGAGKLA